MLYLIDLEKQKDKDYMDQSAKIKYPKSNKNKNSGNTNTKKHLLEKELEALNIGCISGIKNIYILIQ